MIYELRTFNLRSGMVADFEQRYAEALPERTRISPLGGCWHTEIGPLNQVISVWPYESVAQRDQARAEAARAGWPPPVTDLITSEEAWIVQPAPFMRPLEPGQLGAVYEMRVYTVQVGKMPEIIKLWGAAIADREKLSPLAAAWYTDTGPVSTWIHLWPYADLNERARVRAEAQKLGNWPPPTRPYLTKQENRILIPAAYSPLH
jgi:NIPSNAP protein